MPEAWAAVQIDGRVWGYTNCLAIRDQSTLDWHQALLDALGL